MVSLTRGPPYGPEPLYRIEILVFQCKIGEPGFCALPRTYRKNGRERYSGPVDDQLPPYKSPRQKRSRESLERLLEAAEDHIRQNGYESLTINGVVSSIGLSVGAF